MLDPMPCIDYRAAMKQNAMAAQQWFSEYERAAAETDTLRARIAELEAELAAARDKALEDAARMVDCACESREAVLTANTRVERWTACGRDPCGALDAAAIRALIDKPGE